ncbi:nitronate monooxygenase [Chryseobacterium fistulae]|uniref:Uncharacterized protein n=1 Tax=Chryseobacterium fistulae TaxID=2675058 RepID=A0A6N4XUF7_9FLAO|nr:nitronate monooxygenase [Chryseobacterium fistulae]CAA7390392.1 hypothetical protein CHRY9393_02697 [Chryseobacterium fistulae]
MVNFSRFYTQTLLASKQLGAQGFQVGSILLASQESVLKPFEKERLQKINEKEIVLTKSFSGRYARGITNKYIQMMENSEHILPYPYQNKLTQKLRRISKALNNVDFVSIWAGQSIHHYSEQSTENILKNLIVEVESIQ